MKATRLSEMLFSYVRKYNALYLRIKQFFKESPRIIRERTHLQIALYNFLHISVISYSLEIYILFNASCLSHLLRIIVYLLRAWESAVTWHSYNCRDQHLQTIYRKIIIWLPAGAIMSPDQLWGAQKILLKSLQGVIFSVVK